MIAAEIQDQLYAWKGARTNSMPQAVRSAMLPPSWLECKGPDHIPRRRSGETKYGAGGETSTARRSRAAIRVETSSSACPPSRYRVPQQTLIETMFQTIPRALDIWGTPGVAIAVVHSSRTMHERHVKRSSVRNLRMSTRHISMCSIGEQFDTIFCGAQGTSADIVTTHHSKA